MITVLRDKQFQDTFCGKIIKVIAPASGVSHEKLMALRELARNLADFGFTVDIPEDILYQETQQSTQDLQNISYHANSDEKRLELLKAAILDPSENTIVWALRGGYGSARLLDALRDLPVPKHKKIFIGFSDNTALHLFLSQQWGWKTIHGSGFAQILDPEQDIHNFLKIAELVSEISKQEPIQDTHDSGDSKQAPHDLPFSHLKSKTKQDIHNLFFSDIKPMNDCAENLIGNNINNEDLLSFQEALIEVPWTGGNLTLVENSIGTHWQAQTAGKILLLEEVGEKGYRIDRSLYHLYQAGLFDTAKAVILGQFSPPDCVINSQKNVENTENPEINIINIALKRFSNTMNDLNIPVYKTEQFGHGNVNYPFVYNFCS